MTVPQSLLVVALALAWLVVLVPSSSRRRSHVRQTVEGNGFRVLHRPDAPRRKLIRRDKPVHVGSASSAQIDSEGQMSSQPNDVENADTIVLEAVEPAAPIAGSTRYEPEAHMSEEPQATQSPEVNDADTYEDDAELRAQYEAWRAQTRAAEQGELSDEDETASFEVRPIPRKPGRGTYDPEAAERARAYKYARRRRVLLVLVLITLGFTAGALLLTATLWIGAGVAALLLVLFLAYLRRQVRIEADIRERRLAKLERARQIRPERPHTAGESADPYAQRAPGPRQAAGPDRHRTNRVVVDLDDDDPGFDDLEQYEPMEYRRAVGQ